MAKRTNGAERFRSAVASLDQAQFTLIRFEENYDGQSVGHPGAAVRQELLLKARHYVAALRRLARVGRI